jgi:NADPH:quinone reductase-like Zn-dependent oxidoreductase
VGSVIATGEKVTRVKSGDRVAGIFDQSWLSGDPPHQKGLFVGQEIRPGQPKKTSAVLAGDLNGLLAEYVVLPQDGVVRLPEYLKDEEAATLPCAALTSWNALMVQSDIKPGKTMLIQGTGGVSLFALQFALMAGARVIVTSSNDEKLQRVRSIGAHEVINYQQTPEWDKETLRFTDGEGVDYVVDMGGDGTLGRSLNAVRTGGKILLLGVVSHASPELVMLSVLSKQIRLQGVYTGSRSMFEQMNCALVVNKLQPVIDRVFAFEEAHDALRYLEKGVHIGKICIRL